MAQNYEIDIKRFNGQDYDTLLPTPASHASTHQAGGSDPIIMQTGNYADGSITAAKLAPGSVGSTELASDSVTLDKIASAAFDGVPTEDSDNLIRSGAVFEAINDNKPVLVWSNASPSSNFAAQNLTLNLSGHMFVDIAFSVAKGASPAVYKIAKIPVNGRRAVVNMLRNGQTTSALQVIQRVCIATATQIEFEGGSSRPVSATSVDWDDQYAIPLWVWAV